MLPEKAQVPLTLASVKAIAEIAGRPHKPPVIVPISYGAVTAPSELPACIQGVLQDPNAFLMDYRNAPIGPSHLTTDEHGQITDGIYYGISAETLIKGVPEAVTTLWALHLNLADPLMPKKLREFQKARAGMGLVALVTPAIVSEYARGFNEASTVIVYPNPKGAPYVRTQETQYHEYIEP